MAAKKIEGSDFKVQVSGSFKVCMFEGDKGEFQSMPQLVRIGEAFYVRTSLKDLDCKPMDLAYAPTLSLE